MNVKKQKQKVKHSNNQPEDYNIPLGGSRERQEPERTHYKTNFRWLTSGLSKLRKGEDWRTIGLRN